MAIIKCPECGRQVSDKAPVCPNCGVEISGKIIKCPFCGEVYFKNEGTCPHCHKSASTPDDYEAMQNRNAKTFPATSEGTVNAVNYMASKHDKTLNEPVSDTSANDEAEQKSNGRNKTVLMFSIIIALLVTGTCLYVYENAKNDNEKEEYEYAMSSTDQEILQAYLNNFKDAPQAHKDSITAHLQILIRQDQDWTNAVVSGSKTALEEYINLHPNSSHMREALEKIDSIDWEQCLKTNTAEAYQTYIDTHSNGMHYEEAVIALEKIKSDEVSSDERLVISNIFHNFFVSINSKDENGLTANIGEYVNFLGKQNATRSDIVSFLHKLYKDDVESMEWSIPGSYDIQKKEIGDEQYEYDVTFMAEQKVMKIDGTESTNNFRITSKVDPDGKITEMSMARIVE